MESDELELTGKIETGQFSDLLEQASAANAYGVVKLSGEQQHDFAFINGRIVVKMSAGIANPAIARASMANLLKSLAESYTGEYRWEPLTGERDAHDLPRYDPIALLGLGRGAVPAADESEASSEAEGEQAPADIEEPTAEAEIGDDTAASEEPTRVDAQDETPNASLDEPDPDDVDEAAAERSENALPKRTPRPSRTLSESTNRPAERERTTDDDLRAARVRQLVEAEIAKDAAAKERAAPPGTAPADASQERRRTDAAAAPTETQPPPPTSDSGRPGPAAEDADADAAELERRSALRRLIRTLGS